MGLFKKVLYVVAFSFVVIGYSQELSQKIINKRANHRIKRLNKKLTDIDPSLVLSTEQKKKMRKLLIDSQRVLENAKQEGAEESDLKDISRPFYKKMYGMLTEEQAKARKNTSFGKSKSGLAAKPK